MPITNDATANFFRPNNYYLPLLIICAVAPAIVLSILRNRKKNSNDGNVAFKFSASGRNGDCDEVRPSSWWRTIIGSLLIAIPTFTVIVLLSVASYKEKASAMFAWFLTHSGASLEESSNYDTVFHTTADHCRNIVYSAANLVNVYGEFSGLYHRDIDNSTELGGRLFNQGVVHLYGFNWIEANRNFKAALEVIRIYRLYCIC